MVIWILELKSASWTEIEVLDWDSALGLGLGSLGLAFGGLGGVPRAPPGLSWH